MTEVETFCLCECLICGEKFHEWKGLDVRCSQNACCWCPSCERFVGARVIPADLHYRY